MENLMGKIDEDWNKSNLKNDINSEDWSAALRDLGKMLGGGASGSGDAFMNSMGGMEGVQKMDELMSKFESSSKNEDQDHRGNEVKNTSEKSQLSGLEKGLRSKLVQQS